jgi:hypothetical protein
MAEIDRIIKCEGRRRITVTMVDGKTLLSIWIKDPPTGHKIAGLVLEPIEADKLRAALTELKANG